MENNSTEGSNASTKNLDGKLMYATIKMSFLTRITAKKVFCNPFSIFVFLAHDVRTIASSAQENGLYATAVAFYSTLVELMEKKELPTPSCYCNIEKEILSIQKARHLLQSAKKLRIKSQRTTFNTLSDRHDYPVSFTRQTESLCKGYSVRVNMTVFEFSSKQLLRYWYK